MSRIRKMVLGLYFITIAGLIGELVLIEHFESNWQKLPLVFLGLGLLSGLVYLFSQNTFVRRSFQAINLMIVVVGVLGVWMHFNGNAEFELEMYPDRSGFELFWESAKGATPMLAPGGLSGLGFLGLIWAMFPSNKNLIHV